MRECYHRLFSHNPYLVGHVSQQQEKFIKCTRYIIVYKKSKNRFFQKRMLDHLRGSVTPNLFIKCQCWNHSYVLSLIVFTSVSACKLILYIYCRSNHINYQRRCVLRSRTRQTTLQFASEEC